VVFKRIVGGLIILFVIAAVLLTFPQVREIGWGVLASAGVLSLLIGLAASPTIENLVASVQIALSQPIKIDDIVVINGEWGKVEEISSTYVVVLIWDQRRLIVPLSKIVKEPFQNWTRKSQDIIGTVFLYVDYTFPVNALREELKRVTESSPLWDKKVCVLHVTELKEQTMELRCLVSAKNAGNSFDLRCIVRESLIDFLQKNYPHCLPRTRMVYEGPRTPDKSKHPLMLSRLSEHSNVSG
jgi:small-conductance mechanosensitive channel